MAVDPRKHSRVLLEGPDRAAARAMMKAVGFSDAGPLAPADRSGPLLDRNHALQLEPPEAGRESHAGHPGRGRHPDRGQHHLDHRRHHHGHRGHEGLAHQPRSRRRLGGAGGAQPHVRRHRHHLRLRQDDPGHDHGAGPARHPVPHALLRLDHVRTLRGYRGAVRGPQPHHPGRVRGASAPTTRGRSRSSSSRTWRTTPVRARARVAGSSPPTPWPPPTQMLGMSPMGWNDIPAVDPRKEEVAFESGKLVMNLLRRGITPRSLVDPQELRERHQRGHGHRRLDERGAAPARDRARLRGQARHRRLRPHLAPDPGARGPQALGDLHRARDVRRGRHGGGRQAAAGGGPAARLREDGHRSHHRRGGEGGRRARGAAGDQAAREGAQVGGRHRDPAGQPRSGRVRDQALGPEEVRAPRARARVRARGGRLPGGQEGQDQAQRRDRHPLRGPQGRARHARDAARHRRAAGGRAWGRAWRS